MLIAEEYFVLDNVMYWEAFRWERLDTGHIYIQKFQTGKMYAGQTINLRGRMNDYKNLKGSNKHHTRALKKRIDTMQIAITQCPKYLLDAVEIFVIAFYELTDPIKGYNKQTGGRKGFRHTKETRSNMSKSMKGKKNHMYGKTGELSTFFGKHHTEEARMKLSLAQIGKKPSKETRIKLSISRKEGKHPKAKAVCAFGKLYDSASSASKILRDVCDTMRDDNFMKDWAKHTKHRYNVFYVSKEFYNAMKGFTECITRDMYEKWSS